MPDPGTFPILRKYLGKNRVSVVDVGARRGLHTRWGRFESLIGAIGFEADAEECALLNAAAASLPYPATFIPVGLGSVDGAFGTLHICRQPGCSSLFVPNEAFAREFPGWPDMEVVKTMEIPLARMDTILRQRNLTADVVKIDVQGAELDVLRGMGDELLGTLVVELEVEFVEQYLGQPLFHDVATFMDATGFALRGLRRTCWRYSLPRSWRRSARGGQLVHGDALFVNRDLGAIAGSDARADLARRLKGLIALAAYRQDDVVLWSLSRGGGSLAEIPESDRLAIGAELVPHTRSVFGPYLNRLFRSEASRKLRRFVDGLRDGAAEDWHDPDFY